MKPDLPDILIFAGLAAVVAGVGMVSVPGAVILGGLLAAVAGLALAALKRRAAAAAAPAGEGA